MSKLSSLSTLYLNKQNNITDQYDYLTQLINLEQSAGTLSTNNLQTINGWLKKTVTFDELLKEDNPSTATSVSSNATMTSNTPPRSHSRATTPLPQTTAVAQNGNYTIQLYASKNISDAKRYLQNMKNYDNTNLIQSGSWYKVTYGNFSNLADAKIALAQIKQTNSGAWIYRLPDQHTSIAQQNLNQPAATQQPISLQKTDVQLPRPNSA